MAPIRAVATLCAVLAAASTAQAQIAFRAASQSAVAAGASISFVADQHGGGNSTTRTVTRPGGVSVGRLMIAQVAVKGTGFTISAPAGWTLVNSSNTALGSQPFTQAIFWKRMAAGEAGSYTFAWDGVTRRNAAGIVSYDGVDTVGNPIDASAVQTTNNSATINIPGITTLAPNSWIVAMAGSSRSSTHSTPGGMTERYDQNSGGAGTTGVTVSQSTQLIASPGAVAAKTSAIAGGAADNIGHIIALRPRGALTINLPAGTAANDVMIASITFQPCSSTSGGACTVTVTPPSGWTQVNTVTDQTTGAGTGGFGNRLFVYRRVAGASEPASYTWSFGGTPLHAGAAGGIVSFSGVDTASPIVAQAGQATPYATSHEAPSISTGAVTNTMLVSTHTANSSAAWTPPGGMTERVDIASLPVPNNLGLAIEMNHQLFAGSGATGTRTASWTPPPTADTGITHMLALRPNYTHYSVTYPGGANIATCEPALVRIEAHHAGHGLAAPRSGTVLTINTSSGSGVWQSAVVTGSGLWSPSGANNGVATYTWPGTEAVLEVRLRHNTPVSLNLNLSDTQGKSEDPSEDPTLTFADSVLRVTADGASTATAGTQIAAKRSDTGAGAQTLFVQGVATSPATGACTTLFRNQTLNVDFAAVCENPTTCSGAAGTEFEVLNNAASFVSIAKNNGPGAPSTFTAVPLSFSDDPNAMAPLVFRYGDAGQMTLHMRAALPAPPPDTYVSGSSNTFVVRPFGLAFPGVQHGTAETSALLAAAGDNFTMTVAAYKWDAAEDDGTGNPLASANITDNGLTPNFAATTSVSATANLPGVALGTVSRGTGCASAATIAAGSWSGGAATIADWCYSEVGNVLLNATASDYISAGISVSGHSGLDGTGAAGGYVGRFRPKHFALSGGTLANRFAACAGTSAFTYMNEDLRLQFTLTAQNAQNATTQNYTSASGYAKLNPAAIAQLGLGAVNGTTNLTSRLDLALGSSGAFTAGAAGVTLTTAIKRATPDNPDGPYNAVKIGVAPQDSDTVQLQAGALNMDVDNNATNDHQQVGGDTQIRFGRLRLFNAVGSENLALPIQMRVEHWNGSAFAVNTLDSCTTLARTDFRMTSYEKNLAACETGFSAASLAFSSGLATGTLTAPGAGNDGAVTLRVNLTTASGGSNACEAGAAVADTSANRPYLLGRWDGIDQGGDTLVYDDDPAARAAFGLYGSQPRNFIFFRENY
jgi:hypothetical protein